ncbi:MAG: prephenate dehydratase [Actinomycetota bacterium]|nr:prephenate dehydratase [Actinomycetota bacterium]
MPRVAPTRFTYLGPEATFAEQALRTLPGTRTGILTPSASVPDALDAVRNDTADAALVPLENSVEGSVSVTLDELANGEPLAIVREVLLPVSFVLLARPGTSLAHVRTVASHPHGEAQCRGWLRRNLPHATVHSALSTSEGAAAVARGEYDAALAAPLAAERHKLDVLAEDVHDTDGAVTRFVLLSRPGRPPERTGNDRTSVVVFIADNHTGALLEVLTELAVRGIDLTRIESRPTREMLGRYCFCIDCAGHVADARVGEALAALRRICADVRFLGSYPRADTDVAPQPPGTSDDDFADAADWLADLRDPPG